MRVITEHLAIMQNMVNLCDYQEYLSLAPANPMPFHEYLQKIGMVEYGRFVGGKDLPVEDAYKIALAKMRGVSVDDLSGKKACCPEQEEKPLHPNMLDMAGSGRTNSNQRRTHAADCSLPCLS
jgi:hypothetical protein